MKARTNTTKLQKVSEWMTISSISLIISQKRLKRVGSNRIESNKILVRSSNRWMKKCKMEDKKMRNLMNNSMRCLIT